MGDLQILMYILCRAQMHASHEECISLLGGYNVTILMVADPGDASGTAEAKYYIENLEVTFC